MKPKLDCLRMWLFVLLATLISASSYAQQKITGKVLASSNNQPVPGATVQVKGAKAATVTGSDGSFSLTLPAGKTKISISSVGYDDQDVTVTGSEVTVTLAERSSTLNEVVVTGYASQKKKDLTGAVAVVNMEDAKKQPVPDLTDMLQGQAAGVTVLSSGEPGLAPIIHIRGFNTFGNNIPLYVVDGVPTQNINDLNPNDIANMQVLKDAGAASIYGSRAANGVIIISTKKGTGKIKVAYDGYYGTQVPHGGNPYHLLNPQGTAQLEWNALANSGLPLTDPQYGTGPTPVLPDYILPTGAAAGSAAVNPALYNVNPDYSNPNDVNSFYQIVKANKTGTDWYHEIFKSAPITQHNISVSGGGEQGSYLFSLNYFNQQGTLINTYLKRVTLRSNATYKVSNRIRIGENLSYSIIDNPQLYGGNLNEGNAVAMSFRENPIIPVYDIMGNYAGSAGKSLGNAVNPVALQQRTANNDGLTNRLFGNFYGEADILKDLTFRSSFGGENFGGWFHSFAYPTYENAENTTSNSYTEGSWNGYDWTWTNTLNYHKTIGDNDLKVVAGTESYYYTNRNLGGTTLGYFSFDPRFTNLSTGSGTQTNYSNQNSTPVTYAGQTLYSYGAPISLVSYFARVDYAYKEKYLLGATFRRDGSSVFTTNRWGNFPAISAGWRISQEDFLKNVGWITDLKIRGSYGSLGNQINALPTNPFLLYGSNKQGTYYDLAGNSSSLSQGLALQQYANTNGKWENDKSSNIGFDGTFFKGKLDITADWYQKNIDGLLYTLSNPGTAGAAAVPAQNVASMKNNGIDLYADYHVNLTKDLKLNLSGTFTTYNNKITQVQANGATYFEEDARRFNGSNIVRNEVGHSIGQFYGYKIVGFWNSAAQIAAADAQAQKATGNATATYQQDEGVGRFRYADVTNQGYISSASRTFLGNPNPKFSYGLNVGFQFKAFDFSAFFFGVAGNDIFNDVRWWTDFYGSFPGGANSQTALNDSWTPTHQNAKAPIQEAASYFSTNSVPNSYYIEHGGYLRAKNMTLGYTLSPSLLRKAGISRIRAYVQGANLFTITKYTGPDPEIASTGGVTATGAQSTSFGVDEGGYISNRQYLVGVQIVF